MNPVRKNSLFNKKIFLIFGISLVTIGLWLSNNNKTEIQNLSDYQPTRDREFIINIFKNNWHWLIADNSIDFSPEYILDNKASSKNPKDIGNLTIKVALENSKPVGFIAIHPEKLFIGRILFLAVDNIYRGKGYAKKLLEYGLNELKKQEFIKAILITRLENKPARSLYESFGFKEFWRDDTYIRYQKYL